MKVLVIGFPKTGTKSVAEALRILGLKVYDYEEHVYILGNQWRKILIEGCSPEYLREMYEGVDAVTDLPTCYFWEEMLASFPETKIVFMRRENEEVWLQSMKTQIRMASSYPFLSALSTISPTKNRVHALGALIGNTVYGVSLYDCWPFSKKVNDMLLKKVYRAHNAHVLQNAPRNKLLIYDVHEGWGKLCKFLEVEQPVADFPHKNRGGKIMHEMVNNSPMIRRMKLELISALFCLSFAVAIGFLYFFK